MIDGSCRGLDVLANDPRMASGNPQQGDRRTIWLPAALLPVAERMDADPHRGRKLRLCKADEPSQGDNIVARMELAQHEPLPYTCRDRSLEMLRGQFRNISH